MKYRIALLCTTSALALAVPLAKLTVAQVAARQGTPQEAPGRSQFEFTTPMVLEAPLPIVPGEDTIFTDFSRYTCDDVAVRMISFYPKQKKRGWVQVKAKLMLNNGSDVDKYTAVRIEVVSRDEVLAKATRSEMDTESNKVIVRSMELSIPEAAFAPEADAMLRVTVGVTIA